MVELAIPLLSSAQRSARWSGIWQNSMNFSYVISCGRTGPMSFVSVGQGVVLGPLPSGMVLGSTFSLSDEGEEACVAMVSKEVVVVEGLAIGVVITIGGRVRRGGQ